MNVTGLSRASLSAALALLGGSTLSSACNSLFYYPDTYQRLDPERLGLAYEDLRLPVGRAKEQENVHLWLIEPQSEHKPRPTVVHFHGNAENMSSHVLYVAWLVQRGFEVVTFDYRGYGQSTGKVTRSSTIEDGTAVLSHITETLGRRDVFVLGQSLGGAVASATVAQVIQRPTPKQSIKGLVLESTFASYRRLARTKVAGIWLLWPFQFPLSYLVTDEGAPGNSMQHLGSVPTLHLHGDADPVVPLSEGKALFEDAKQWSAPAITRRWVTIPGGGHTPAFGSATSPYREQLVAFLCEHSSTRASAACAQRSQSDTQPKQAPEQSTK